MDGDHVPGQAVSVLVLADRGLTAEQDDGDE